MIELPQKFLQKFKIFLMSNQLCHNLGRNPETIQQILSQNHISLFRSLVFRQEILKICQKSLPWVLRAHNKIEIFNDFLLLFDIFDEGIIDIFNLVLSLWLIQIQVKNLKQFEVVFSEDLIKEDSDDVFWIRLTVTGQKKDLDELGLGN